MASFASAVGRLLSVVRCPSSCGRLSPLRGNRGFGNGQMAKGNRLGSPAKCSAGAGIPCRPQNPGKLTWRSGERGEWVSQRKERKEKRTQRPRRGLLFARSRLSKWSGIPPPTESGGRDPSFNQGRCAKAAHRDRAIGKLKGWK